MARRIATALTLAAITLATSNRTVSAASELTEPSEFNVDPCVLAPVFSGCTARVGLPLLLRAVPEFRERLSREGVVAFRGYDGHRVGGDADFDLAFFANGKVELLAYGYTLLWYAGTYRVDDGGGITVRFASSSGWPDMMLERDERSLVLRPADPPVASQERTGWPLRSLGPKASTRALELFETMGTAERRR